MIRFSAFSLVLIGLLISACGAEAPLLATASETSAPTASETSAPTASETPAPSASEAPSASMLPRLGLPGTRASAAGDYGWTGTFGSWAGMHSVIENETSPAGFRQTQLVFAVQDDCFATAPGAAPAAVTIAGLDGLHLEPYDDPSVLFIPPRGGETTGAYALPIAALTLCVYLTWDDATTPGELDAARDVVDSIRGEPFGQDGIRINFTLPAGWDTG